MAVGNHQLAADMGTDITIRIKQCSENNRNQIDTMK